MLALICTAIAVDTGVNICCILLSHLCTIASGQVAMTLHVTAQKNVVVGDMASLLHRQRNKDQT